MNKSIISILLLITLFFLLLTGCSKTEIEKYPIRTYSYAEFEENLYYDSNKENQVFCNNKKIGSYIGSSHGKKLSLDGSIEVHYTSSGLYLFNKKEVYKITDTYPYFSMAAEGNFVLHRDSESNLWLFNCKNYDNTMIAEKVSLNCISPNGKYILYTTVNDNGESELYVFSDKKAKLVCTNVTPLSISNDGECIYAVADNSLYYINGKTFESKEIAENYGISSFSDDCDPLYNRTHSEILFVSDSKGYICVNGETIHEVFSDCFSYEMIVPEFASYALGLDTYNAEHLSDCLYSVWPNSGYQDITYYIDNDYNCTQLGDYRDVIMSTDGKTLFCRDAENDIYVLDLTGNVEDQKIARNVLCFTISRDNQLYYLDSNNELHHNIEGKDKIITSGVVAMDITVDDILVFMSNYDPYTQLGTMCSVNASGKISIVDEDVHAFYNVGSCMYYQKGLDRETDHSDIYAHVIDGKFELIAKEICSTYGSSNWMDIYYIN